MGKHPGAEFAGTTKQQNGPGVVHKRATIARWYALGYSSTMKFRDAASDSVMSEPYYATSRDAERAFYDAFQNADLDDMMNIWSAHHDIICIHPMGPRLEGREAVAQSWRQIFSGGSTMRFDLTVPLARYSAYRSSLLQDERCQYRGHC